MQPPNAHRNRDLLVADARRIDAEPKAAIRGLREAEPRPLLGFCGKAAAQPVFSLIGAEASRKREPRAG